MIHRFHNPETASLFAAKLRSEGHFARVLDTHVSHLWGPLPMGGARVLASPEPVPDAAPPTIPGSRLFMPLMRTLVVAWVPCAIGLGIATLMRSPPRHARPLDPSGLVAVAVCAVACLAVSLAMIRWTRHDRLRPAGAAMHRFWFWFVVFYYGHPLLFSLWYWVLSPALR